MAVDPKVRPSPLPKQLVAKLVGPKPRLEPGQQLGLGPIRVQLELALGQGLVPLVQEDWDLEYACFLVHYLGIFCLPIATVQALI